MLPGEKTPGQKAFSFILVSENLDNSMCDKE